MDDGVAHLHERHLGVALLQRSQRRPGVLRVPHGVPARLLQGGVRFPEVRDVPYQLSLDRYGFLWFRFDPPRAS